MQLKAVGFIFVQAHGIPLFTLCSAHRMKLKHQDWQLNFKDQTVHAYNCKTKEKVRIIISVYIQQ